MFERLNERATKVMALAHDEAARYHHPYVGTEHILLGLADEGEGIGANVLKGFGIDLAWIRPKIEKLSPAGAEPSADPESLPQTPRAKKVIECAFEEARGLNHSQVGTEHLLLGLLRVREGVAAMVLTQFGLSTEAVRQAIVDLVSIGAKAHPPPAAPPPAAAPPDYTLAPSRLAEAWFSIVIGAILIFMMPNTVKYLLSSAHLAEAPLITMGDQIIPYARSAFFLPDLGVDVFGAVLIVDGLLMLLVRRRGRLYVSTGLMAVAVGMNLIAMIVAWPTLGFQIICALAVGFGGYRLFDLIGRLRS
jgi:hypothetical protein